MQSGSGDLAEDPDEESPARPRIPSFPALLPGEDSDSDDESPAKPSLQLLQSTAKTVRRALTAQQRRDSNKGSAAGDESQGGDDSDSEGHHGLGGIFDEVDEEEHLCSQCPDAEDGAAGAPDGVKQRQSKVKRPKYWWDSNVYFPGGCGEVVGLHRQSRLRALEYDCCSQGCNSHSCVRSGVNGDPGLSDSDVLYARQAFNAEAGRKLAAGRTELLFTKMKSAWSNPSGSESGGTFAHVHVPLEDSRTVALCVRSYAVVVAAVSYDTFVRVRAAVNKGSQQYTDPAAPSSSSLTFRESVERELRSYLFVVASKRFAHNPTPGARNVVQFGAPRETWSARWQQCVQDFADRNEVAPGNKTILRRVWRSMPELHTRADINQDKCMACFKIHQRRRALDGNNSEQAKHARIELDKAEAMHKQFHETERDSYDEAATQAIWEPSDIWTICVDAATQSNFELPRFKGRKPKGLDAKMPWGSKLFGAYAHGHGLHVYTVPPYVGHGANLTVTVIHKTLMEMVASGRPTPRVLHIQLDNTTGENKNNLVFTYACWLVQTGFVQKVRIFFLPVGHTHIFIDHVFGTITKHVRLHLPVLTEKELLACVEAACAENKTYMRKTVAILHGCWDWTSFFSQVVPDMEAAFGGYSSQQWIAKGFHDFLVSLDPTEKRAHIEYRKTSQASSYLPAEHKVFILPSLPEGTPPYREPVTGWQDLVRTSVEQMLCARHAAPDAEKRLLLNQWVERINDAPASLEANDPGASLLQESLKFEFLQASGGARAHGARVNASDVYCVDDVIPEEYVDLYDEIENPDFDPTHHASRPKHVVNKEMHAFLSSQREHGPVTAPVNAKTDCNYVFPGDFVLAAPPSGAHGSSSEVVALYKVCKVEAATFRSSNMRFTGTKYAHTPQASQPGMFGTFAIAVNDAAATYVGPGRKHQLKTIRHQMGRENIKVYNCALVKSKHLNLRTLHCLAAKLPSSFPVPTQVPATHKEAPLASSKRKAAASSKQGGGKRRAPSSHTVNSSESESEDEEDEGEEEEDEGEEEDEEDDALEEVSIGDHVFINLYGNEEFKGHRYPVGLLSVTALDSDNAKLKGRWFTNEWQSFEPPERWKFHRTMNGDRWTESDWMELTSCILGVKLEWNKAPSFGRVLLSKRSSTAMCEHLRLLDPPLENKHPA